MALPTFPRYLTLSAEERAKLGLTDTGISGATHRSRLLKAQEFTVAYPDGTEGTCRYERLGPAWHRFDYQHGEEAARTALPRQYWTKPLGNTPAEIEEAGKQMAASAFAEAIERERTDYFRRATPPSGAAPDPKAFQFSAKRGNEIGGRYTLCIRLGKKLIPVGSQLYRTLSEANAAWQERPEGERATLVVGCACRWSRRWEEPKYNPVRSSVAEYAPAENGGATDPAPP